MSRPNLFRAMRERAGVSVERAADHIGYRVSTFRGKERAQSFSAGRIDRLAELYGCTWLDFILTRDTEGAGAQPAAVHGARPRRAPGSE